MTLEDGRSRWRGGHESRFVAHYDLREILAGAETGPSGLPPAVVRAFLRATGAVRHIRAADGVLAGTPVAGLVAVEQVKDVMLSIQRCAGVWIAAINGHAMGGGCELSLACDLRYMAAGDWRIGQPEILLGFPPGGGGTQRLTRLLGTARAIRICLEGLPMSAAEALELGLVNGSSPETSCWPSRSPTRRGWDGDRRPRSGPASAPSMRAARARSWMACASRRPSS